jgi:hypothetical protein
MPNFKSWWVFCKRFSKYSKIARVARKVEGNITFDQGTQLEKKLVFDLGGTCLGMGSKLHEHPTKNDFVGTY